MQANVKYFDVLKKLEKNWQNSPLQRTFLDPLMCVISHILFAGKTVEKGCWSTKMESISTTVKEEWRSR